MDYTYLKVASPEDGICLLTLSSPKTLNALNSALLKELDRFVDEVSSGPLLGKYRVLLLTGDGEKAFVAGADISEMRGMNPAEALAFAQLGSSVFRRLEDLDIPTIALVNGYALGGGCELAMACDLRIASSSARFGQPETGLGIIPGFSGTVRLTRLCGPAYAKELIYTGKAIKADEAFRIGLVNAVVAPEQLMDEGLNWARRILANGRLAVSQAKSCIAAACDLSRDEAIAVENRHFSDCFSTGEQQEGMRAFLEKRKPDFH